MTNTLKRLVVIGVLVLAKASTAAALDIVTTTSDLAAIAKAVGGDLVSAESLTRGFQDPHYAEAKPSMIRKVYDADLLLLVGAEFEVGWLPAVLSAGRNRDVMPGTPGFLDLSTTVDLLEVPTGPVDRSQGDTHASGNPHYWLDPENGRIIAIAIANRLSELDAANAAHYASGLAAFERQLDAKLAEWRSRLTNLSGRDIIAYHKSLPYLGAAFSFNIIGHVEPKPGIAPGAQHLNQLIQLIESKKVPLLLREIYFERQSTEFLEARTGIKAVEFHPSVAPRAGVDTYFDIFERLVEAITASGAL